MEFFFGRKKISEFVSTYTFDIDVTGFEKPNQMPNFTIVVFFDYEALWYYLNKSAVYVFVSLFYSISYALSRFISLFYVNIYFGKLITRDL